MSTTWRLVLVTLLSILAGVLIWLSRQDMFIAGGSDAATDIFRHELWSQLLAAACFLLAISYAFFSRNAGVAMRTLVALLGIACLAAALHVLSFTYRGSYTFEEHYGPFQVQSISLNQESERPLTFTEGLLVLRLKNDEGQAAAVVRWVPPWRFGSDRLLAAGHLETES